MIKKAIWAFVGYILGIVGMFLFIAMNQNPIGILVFIFGALMFLYNLGGFIVTGFRKLFN